MKSFSQDETQSLEDVIAVLVVFSKDAYNFLIGLKFKSVLRTLVMSFYCFWLSLLSDELDFIDVASTTLDFYGLYIFL